MGLFMEQICTAYLGQLDKWSFELCSILTWIHETLTAMDAWSFVKCEDDDIASATLSQVIVLHLSLGSTVV